MSSDERMRRLQRRTAIGGDGEAEAELLAMHVRRGWAARLGTQELRVRRGLAHERLRWTRTVERFGRFMDGLSDRLGARS